MEPKIYGTKARIHTAATVGWLRAGHWAQIIPDLWIKRVWHLPCNSCYRRPAILHAAWQSFILTLGTPAAQNVSPQTGTLAQRALEESERTLCENKAVAILSRCKPADPHPKDGGEMLIAIVLDRPLADAKACFFRPTPSWLSPGRYTRSTAAKRELWIMQGRLHVDSLKSAVIGR